MTGLSLYHMLYSNRYRSCRNLLFLVIALVGIDGPYVLLGRLAVLDIADGLDCGGHGMIHVVVTMLAVAADAIQIAEGIEVFHELRHAIVGVEICRIRLLHALTMGVDHVLRTVDDLHARKLLDGELLRFLVRHVPEGIAFFAEVFKTDPHGVVNVLDQVRACLLYTSDAADE